MEAYRLGKIKIKVPSGWHEIPYSTAMDLLDNNYDQVQTLAILTGKTPEEIRRATDIGTIFYFHEALLYLSELPEFNEFPRSVKMGADRLVFPFVSYADEFDLGQCEFGQVEDMKDIIAKMNKEFIGDEERELLTKLELIKIMPHIVAIYVQKLLDGEYDGKKAANLVDRVKKELSFKEVVSIGTFFFRRLIALINGSTSALRKRRSMKRKLKLALLNSIQRLVSMLP